MSDGLGGLLGAALGLYVIHEVLKDGKTGRRIGYVRARSVHHAKQIISRKKKIFLIMSVFSMVKIFQDVINKHIQNLITIEKN